MMVKDDTECAIGVAEAYLMPLDTLQAGLERFMPADTKTTQYFLLELTQEGLLSWLSTPLGSVFLTCALLRTLKDSEEETTAEKSFSLGRLLLSCRERQKRLTEEIDAWISSLE